MPQGPTDNKNPISGATCSHPRASTGVDGLPAAVVGGHVITKTTLAIRGRSNTRRRVTQVPRATSWSVGKTNRQRASREKASPWVGKAKIHNKSCLSKVAIMVLLDLSSPSRARLGRKVAALGQAVSMATSPDVASHAIFRKHSAKLQGSFRSRTEWRRMTNCELPACSRQQKCCQVPAN